MKAYTLRTNCQNPKTLLVYNDYSTAILHYRDYVAVNANDVVYGEAGDYTLDDAIIRLNDMILIAKQMTKN